MHERRFVPCCCRYFDESSPPFPSASPFRCQLGRRGRRQARQGVPCLPPTQEPPGHDGEAPDQADIFLFQGNNVQRGVALIVCCQVVVHGVLVACFLDRVSLDTSCARLEYFSRPPSTGLKWSPTMLCLSRWGLVLVWVRFAWFRYSSDMIVSVAFGV